MNMDEIRRLILDVNRSVLVNAILIIGFLINSYQNHCVGAFQSLTSVLNTRHSVSTAERSLIFYAKSGKKFFQNDSQSSKGASGDVKLKTRRKIRSKGVSRPLPITDEELAHHVSSMYTHGTTGVARQVMKKRERIEKVASQPRDSLDKEQRDYLRMLDKHLTLVLNADYQPLSVLPLSMWSWQETIKSVFSGKVTVVEVYSDVTIRAVNCNVPLPSVIALNEFCPQPHQTPAFTRRNVFLRDGYRCQYCQKRYKFQDLSLDHLHPRCMGGQLKWENTVTSCRKCNGRKGSTLPKDLRLIGMKLTREPRVPTKYELAIEAQNMVPRIVHPTWRPYLGMGFTSNKKLVPGEDCSSFLDEHP